MVTSLEGLKILEEPQKIVKKIFPNSEKILQAYATLLKLIKNSISEDKEAFFFWSSKNKCDACITKGKNK